MSTLRSVHVPGVPGKPGTPSPLSSSSSSSSTCAPSSLCRSTFILLLISLALLIPLVAAEAPFLRSPAIAKVLIPVPQQVSVDSVIVDTNLDSVPPPSQYLDLHKRAPPPANATPTTVAGATPTSSGRPRNTANAGVSRTSSMPVPTNPAAASWVPDPKGDMALFGQPSVVGAYNLTSGILIYSAFMILFVGTIGFATWRRAKYRNQFRAQQQLNMEGGRVGANKGSKGNGGEGELSDAALFKQASISKRALMKDVGPGGVGAANEALKNKITGDYEHSSGMGVRFGENDGSNRPSGRTGGMKKTRGDVVGEGGGGGGGGSYEMNAYGQTDQSMYYQDNQDMTDYSRPPLESADPYYSSGSSHSGYLDQVEDYPNTQKPQFAQPMIVQRTNSARMPKTDLHDSNNIYRSDSGRGTSGLDRNGSGSQRIATQGLSDRGGANSPVDGMSRTGSSASSNRTRVAPSPTLAHPTPIMRSNSTRLPPSMRGGTPQPPSNLSQQTNNYEYM